MKTFASSVDRKKFDNSNWRKLAHKISFLIELVLCTVIVG